MEDNYDNLFKVLLIGDSSVGKTSVLLRYTDSAFTCEFQTTIGVDFRIKNIPVKNKIIKLQLWDTAGQDRFRRIVSSYYRGAHGVIIVYDITNKESFLHVNDWLEQCNLRTDLIIPKLLIGNKSDLESQRIITTEEGQELANSLKMGFIETSAKQCININAAFDRLSNEMLDAHTRNLNISPLSHIIGKGAPASQRSYCC